MTFCDYLEEGETVKTNSKERFAGIVKISTPNDFQVISEGVDDDCKTNKSFAKFYEQFPKKSTLVNAEDGVVERGGKREEGDQVC